MILRWSTGRFYSSLVLLLLVVLVVSACGNNQAAAPTTAPEPAAAAPTEPPEPTAEPSPTVEPTPERSLEDVRTSVIQIEAEGTFVDPEEGMLRNAAGRGSGFIIDEAGIAVTNNHVVTGAAILRVFIDGEDTPRNARVLGASECSDLAVIDIDGDDLQPLTWFEDDLSVGLDIFAAGFPLGDPEFTLTRGIISKAVADGESPWASVDRVVEHDAVIRPGNSGGPLVTANGEVVGVNYAGFEGGPYYAIGREEALKIIDELRAGNDVTSIGVNGEAISFGDIAGIWVASVKSGSPADQTGIRPGDIITALEGLDLATDGTMADYCDILRSRNPGDVMSVNVYRFETGEFLVGQLNGDRELALDESFVTAVEATDTGTSYTEYREITDDTGSLTVEVPVEWSDTFGGEWTEDGTTIGVAVAAAPDRQAWAESWTMPGIFFGASRSLVTQFPDENDLLDLYVFDQSCTYGGREAYSDGLYIGAYDIWTDCGGTDTTFLVIAALPETRDFVAVVQVQIVSEADLEALDRVIDTFIVSGDF